MFLRKLNCSSSMGPKEAQRVPSSIEAGSRRISATLPIGTGPLASHCGYRAVGFCPRRMSSMPRPEETHGYLLISAGRCRSRTRNTAERTVVVVENCTRTKTIRYVVTGAWILIYMLWDLPLHFYSIPRPSCGLLLLLAYSVALALVKRSHTQKVAPGSLLSLCDLILYW